MSCAVFPGVNLFAHLSAELSGSMNRISGGADSVSVANIPPCSWTPKPLRGSPVRMISLVSTWTTWPPGPTELDARDTKHTQIHMWDRCFSLHNNFTIVQTELTGAFVLFLPLPSFEQWVTWTHGNCRPGQGAGALATWARCSRRAGRETGRYQSYKKRERKERWCPLFPYFIYSSIPIFVSMYCKKERKT